MRDKRIHDELHGLTPEGLGLGAPAVTGVVVGVDGSASVLGAVVWAAAEAARLDLPLHLVQVLPPSARKISEPMRVPRGLARALLRRARRTAESVAPGVPVTMTTVNGVVGSALVSYSAPGRMLVVGPGLRDDPRQRSTNRTLAILAAHAQRPVVAVPSTWTAARVPAASTQPVVVGVDSSPAGLHALSIAAETADALGVPLLPVTSVGAIETSSSRSPAGSDENPGTCRVTESLDSCRRCYPLLTIGALFEARDPVKSLLVQGRRAQLIVAGARGRATERRPHLGSAAQLLLRSSVCPVLVVPPALHSPSAPFSKRT